MPDEPNDNQPVDDVKPDETDAPTPPEGDEDAKPDADADADKGDDADKKKPDLSLEDALSEVTKTRAEAANYRTRAKAAEKALAEAKTLEEVQQIIDKMTAERESAERTLLAENVALTHGLPSALAARLQGNTRDELEADAKALAELVATGDDDDRPRRPKGGLDPSEGDDESDGADPGALARLIRR